MKMTARDVFDANALQYENKFMHLDLYNATYDALLQNLAPNAALLEIGCGPGNISRYLLDKRPDLKILATDFSVNMIELAGKNLPEADVLLLDAKHASSLNRKFDAVVCGFVAPYFDKRELKKLILSWTDVLNQNGLIYISCIKGKYANSGWLSSSDAKTSAFVHYYDEIDLVKMLSEANFRALEKFEIGYGNDVHLILIGANEPSYERALKTES